LTVRLSVGGVVVSELSAPCSSWGDWCTPSADPKPYPASDYWTLWQGGAGGELRGRIVLHYRDASTGAAGTWDSGSLGLRRSIDRVRTAGEIENSPPDVYAIGFPDADSPAPLYGSPSLHRSEPEHLQEFTAFVDDFEGHNLAHARLDIFDPDGSLWDTYDWPTQKSNPVLARPLLEPYPVEITSPPLRLPHRNGTYTARLQATDSSGRPTAPGLARTYAFTYIWNLAPIDPTQIVPDPHAQRPDDPGRTFPPNVPVAFVSKATDPENDRLTMETVIDDGRVYHSIPTASGREAVTIIHDGFAPESRHTAKVRGIDLHDAGGDFGPTLQFSVLPVGAVAPNRPPGVPTLVAPVNGGQLTASQDFTIQASDPDNDRWRGVIQVQDNDGTTVAEFATDETASGATVTARPLVPLRPGPGYRWRATALDNKGNLGPTSTWQSFTV
jgi:hypothetical protein